MKKIISLISALALFLSVQGISVFGETWFETMQNERDINWRTDSIVEKTDEPNGEQEVVETDEPDYNYEMLSTLGIVAGAQGKSLSRGEFVAAAMKLLGIENPGDGAGSVFEDVDEKTANGGFINYAYNFGIIKNSDGKFYPDKLISYNEAVTILVRTMGRGDLAESLGGFPSGYIAAAKKCDILGREITPDNKAASAKVLYKLLVSAAESTEFSVITGFKTDSVEYAVGNGKNMLENYLKVYTFEDIVKSVGTSSIYPLAKSEKTKAQIGSISFECEYRELIDYLGYRVKVLYKYDRDKDECELLYITKSNFNEVLTIAAEDIEDYSGSTYTYWDENSKRTAKTSAPSVVYNGKLASGTISDLYKPAYGYVVLIDNDRDGAYEVIIEKSRKDIVAAGIDKSEEIIYDKYDAKKKVCLKNEDGDKIIDFGFAGGKEAYIGLVSEGYIISVYESSDGQIVSAVISDKKVSGTISSSRTKDGKTYVVLDGEEYCLTAVCKKNCESVIKVGSAVTLRLNVNGEVADVDEGIENASNGFRYGYIISIGQSSSALSEEVKIKMLNDEGDTSIYLLAENCIIDEVSCKGKTKQVNALNQGLGTGRVVKYILAEEPEEETAVTDDKESAEESTDEESTDEESTEGEEDEEFEKDVVRTVKVIDTVYRNEEKEDEKTTLRQIDYSTEFPSGLHHKHGGGYGNFEELFWWSYTDGKTVVFQINNNETADEDRYTICTTSFPYTNDQTGCKPEAYIDNEGYYACALVDVINEATTATVSNKNLYAVSKIYNSINSKSMEETVVLEVNDGSGAKEITVKKEVFDSLGVDENGVDQSIEVGDIIICDMVNNKVKGKSLIKVYDFGDDKITDSKAQGWFANQYVVRKGFVYDKRDGLIAICVADKPEEILAATADNIKVDKLQGKYAVIEKSGKGEVAVKNGSTGDLNTYQSMAENCSKVIVRLEYVGIQQIFVIK